VDRDNSNTVMFAPYGGDLIGLPTDSNHLVFRWARDGCKILFSVTKRGLAASCHFASDKAGLRHIKQAINEFSTFVFDLFKWCTMILAVVAKDSIGRLITKCEYTPIGQLSDVDGGEIVYMRVRDV